mgnify:CR=1 FL=1
MSVANFLNFNTAALPVIGNGPGEWPKLDSRLPFVRFNIPADAPFEPGEIRICNRKFAGRLDDSPPFVVWSRVLSSVQRICLQARLAYSGATLMKRLGSLPSSGLATVHALATAKVTLHLYRIPLRPSLLRPVGLSVRKPLAASFHNWLGERRLALRWCRSARSRLHWPDLQLTAGEETPASDRCEDPYPALFHWFAKGTDEARNANLAHLAELPAAAWCQYATSTRLKELEAYFYLRRQQRESANWWLYNNELSPLIDALLLKLMLAQQHLASVRAEG